jgi:endonuclease/exonuclease/phosphatase family metal-dependent hydrolase
MLINRRNLLSTTSAGLAAFATDFSSLGARPIGPSRADAMPLRAMTYNIRLATEADGENVWRNRRRWVSAQISWLQPDIFGLQEVVFSQKQDIIADLPDYHLVGNGRDDGRDGGESSPLGYSIARFEMQACGTLWLSPTPDRPSKGWDAAFPRVATWARLVARSDGRPILAINTHWDHVGVEARNHSASLLSTWLAEHRQPRDHIIFLGDFNADVDSEAMRLLTDAHAPVRLRDSRAASQSEPFGPAGTFNDFKLQPDTTRTIDHILVGDDITVRRFAVIAQNVDGRMLSDHYPVLADLLLGSASTI